MSSVYTPPFNLAAGQTTFVSVCPEQKQYGPIDGIDKKVDLLRDEMKTNFERMEEEVHFALKKNLENKEAIRALNSIKK